MFSDKLAVTHASCGSQLATMHRADPYHMDIRRAAIYGGARIARNIGSSTELDVRRNVS